MEEILEAFLDSSPNTRDGLIADSIGTMVLVNLASLSNGCVNMVNSLHQRMLLCPPLSLLSEQQNRCVWHWEVAEEEASVAVLDTPFFKATLLKQPERAS